MRVLAPDCLEAGERLPLELKMPDGGWDVALALPERPDPVFANISVKAADVTGDGRPELLVGYRAAGTGQFEAYDVITYEQGKPLEVAAHRPRLHKASGRSSCPAQTA